MPSSINSFLALFTTLFAAAAVVVSASPTPFQPSSIQPHEFEVYAPPVTAPNASSVWNVGDTQTVAWDTSKIDDQGLNTTGYLLLGYYVPGDDSEHLDISACLFLFVASVFLPSPSNATSFTGQKCQLKLTCLLLFL